MGQVLADKLEGLNLDPQNSCQNWIPVAYPLVISVPTGRWGMETGCLDTHNLVYTEASKTALSKQCGR